MQRMTSRPTLKAAGDVPIMAPRPEPDSESVHALLDGYGRRAQERAMIELWTLQVEFDQFIAPEPTGRPRLKSNTPSGGSKEG